MKNTAPIKTKFKLLFFSLIALGLINSFFITFHNIPVESDTANTVTLWNGWHQYGYEFLRTYRYTIDNWFFSLVPIHFALFSVFGPSQPMVIVSGWLIYVCIIFLIYVICRQVGIKNSRANHVLLFLVFANTGTLWYCGYLSYSVSHNISVLFFLISFSLFLKFRNFSAVIGFLFINLCASISDPWNSFAFILPAMLASAFVYLRGKDKSMLWLSLACAICFVINVISVKTSVFGLFPNAVGSRPFHLNIDVLVTKLHFIARTFGFFFEFLPTSIVWKEAQDGMVISLWLLAIIFSCVNFYKKIKFKTDQQVLLFLLAILSMLSLLASEILFAEVAADFSGRYIITIFLFTPVIMALGLEFKGNNKTGKVIFYVFLLLYMMASINTARNSWNLSGLEKKRPTEVTELLEKYGLNFGYGLYWDSMAPAVTWMNDSQITLRSVLFDYETKMLTRSVGWQTSPLWYRKEDAANQPDRQFIILKNSDYGDPCGDDKVSSCLTPLTEQFGKPERVIREGDYTLFIWNHKLTNN